MPTGLGTVEHRKQPVANIMVRPCGLGCQQLGPCCYAYGGNTFVCMAITLWVGSCSTQLLFYTARERMIVQNLPATDGNLGREQGVPDVHQDDCRMGFAWLEELEVAESRVPGWAASFSTAHQVQLGLGQIFVNPLHYWHEAGSEVFVMHHQILPMHGAK